MLYFSSSFIFSHNIVCLAHMYTGNVFIATPTIPIVKRAKKSPVSDLQNTFECIHMYFFSCFLHLILYSQVNLKSLAFTIVPIEILEI